MDALYEAFRGYGAPSGGFCRDCFDPETERGIMRPGPLRRKPYEEFSPIYYEHIDCSVGAGGFMYFLPRALEACAFEPYADADLLEGAVKCGLHVLPDRERGALLNVFARAAQGWFEGGDMAPLIGPVADCAKPYAAGDWPNVQAGEFLVRALLNLRVRPDRVFSWLASRDTPGAWMCLCALLSTKAILERPVYFALDGHEQALGNTVDALDRVARSDLFATISRDRLLDAWTRHGSGDQDIERRLSEAEIHYGAYRFVQSSEQQTADLELILDTLTLGIEI